LKEVLESLSGGEHVGEVTTTSIEEEERIEEDLTVCVSPSKSDPNPLMGPRDEACQEQ
jgi:hypothetical protein